MCANYDDICLTYGCNNKTHFGHTYCTSCELKNRKKIADEIKNEPIKAPEMEVLPIQKFCCGGLVIFFILALILDFLNII
ncbi:hypothetical protein [Methanobrevibacter sp. DSM 116169]|uniref:hypothetical protein n=1 Tax=Methanobrevibacter sp. DSM 116169 TaxID=3242727 RepID=UPI0038FBF900